MQGYRTLLLNLGALALVIVDYLMGSLSLIATVFGSSQKGMAMVTIALGLANIVLRFKTTTPVGIREDRPRPPVSDDAGDSQLDRLDKL